MWSHYSDNHKGICLEFRAKDTLFGSALRITYHTEYPKMVLGENFAPMMLTAKAKDWEKEEDTGLCVRCQRASQRLKEARW